MQLPKGEERLPAAGKQERELREEDPPAREAGKWSLQEGDPEKGGEAG